MPDEAEIKHEVARLVRQGLTEEKARELVTEPYLDLPIGPDGKPAPLGRLSDAPPRISAPVEALPGPPARPRPTSGTAYYRFRSDDGDLDGLVRLRDGVLYDCVVEGRWVERQSLARYFFNPPSEGDLVEVDPAEARRAASFLGVALEARAAPAPAPVAS